MEAASRPVFEPLSDLPVEAPIDEGVPVGAAPSPSGDSAKAGSRKAGSEDSADELIDPESLLGSSEPDLLLDALNEAAASGLGSGTSAAATAPTSTAFEKDAEDLLGLEELLLTEEPAESGGPGAGAAPGAANAQASAQASASATTAVTTPAAGGQPGPSDATASSSQSGSASPN